MDVTVILTQPLNEPIEGWVEVRGIGQGKCHIAAEHYLMLRDSIMNTFGKLPSQ